MTVLTAAPNKPKAKGTLPGWTRTLSLLRESPVGMIGLFLVLFWIVVAIFAPLLAPYPPNANLYEAGVNADPSAEHWLGTDDQARDLLSRIIYGSRLVLTIAPLATLCAYIVGCTIGLLAGYYRGWVDGVLMQICNIILSFPDVVIKHAMRNALITPFTAILMQLNFLFTSVVIVEMLFAFPGFGRMIVDAALNSDLDVIESASMFAVLVVVSSQIVGDFVYMLLNPRIRFS